LRLRTFSIDEQQQIPSRNWVGLSSQRYACEASGAEGVEHHRIMKPSSTNHQLGWSSGNTRRAQDDNSKTPPRTETGLDAKENIHVSAEGRGKLFS